MNTSKQIALSAVLAELQKDKAISPHSVSILTKHDRQVPIPSVPTQVFEDPIYVAIVIDNSISMEPYQAAVVESQNKLLDDLRESDLCRHKALRVATYLFAEHIRQINEFSLLDKNGADEVTKLDMNTYTFDNWTALYQAVFQVLQDVATFAHFCRQEFVSSRFDLAVITDGDDNKSQITAAEIKTVVQDMKNKEIIRKSIVIGLTGTKLDDAKVECIRESMGFDVAITIGQNSSAIRAAFRTVTKLIFP